MAKTSIVKPINAPLIVIVGETASGKTDLALKVAKQFNGEIICADSRTVYKGMDIGTAKPTKKEQASVRHHLLDVVEPSEKFSAKQFKDLALKAIDDISSRGKLPVMVGGSGLYVDSVIYDYQFSDSTQAQRRNPVNPRHLDKSVKSLHSALRPNTLIIGLSIDRGILKNNIKSRVNKMIENGFVDEVKKTIKQYGERVPAMQAPGYRAFAEYLTGDATLDGAKNEFIKNDLALAKRQRTWFKRNKSIHWVDEQSKAVDLITTFLNN